MSSAAAYEPAYARRVERMKASEIRELLKLLDKKNDAITLLKASLENPAFRVERIGMMLEELDRVADAETIFRELASRTGARRHARPGQIPQPS